MLCLLTFQAVQGFVIQFDLIDRRLLFFIKAFSIKFGKMLLSISLKRQKQKEIFHQLHKHIHPLPIALQLASTPSSTFPFAHQAPPFHLQVRSPAHPYSFLGIALIILLYLQIFSMLCIFVTKSAIICLLQKKSQLYIIFWCLSTCVFSFMKISNSYSIS